MKYIQSLLLLRLLFLSSGCSSAETIKSHSYPTTKDNLEKVVLKVVKSNSHIVIDTTQAKVSVTRNSDNANDTFTVSINLSDFHSPDSAYVAATNKSVIKIKVWEIENDYTFRYLGDEQHWKSSAISVQNATNKYGNSISEGKNENRGFDSKMAKDFTSLFERELVSKIDKEVCLKHTID